MAGNPWDRHALAETVKQASIFTDKMPKTVIVDLGYRGVVVNCLQILRSGQGRGVTRGRKAMSKRQNAIVPTIRNMRTDGRLGRNPLKEALGEALHDVLCFADHNIRRLWPEMMGWLRAEWSGNMDGPLMFSA